jgi:hypothetical protein
MPVRKCRLLSVTFLLSLPLLGYGLRLFAIQSSGGDQQMAGPRQLPTSLPWFSSYSYGGNMRVTRATEDEETHRHVFKDQSWIRQLDTVPSGAARDAGHVTKGIGGTTLMERVVGFMERYKGSLYA